MWLEFFLTVNTFPVGCSSRFIVCFKLSLTSATFLFHLSWISTKAAQEKLQDIIVLKMQYDLFISTEFIYSTKPTITQTYSVREKNVAGLNWRLPSARPLVWPWTLTKNCQMMTQSATTLPSSPNTPCIFSLFLPCSNNVFVRVWERAAL